jgi:hypothetical protein
MFCLDKNAQIAHMTKNEVKAHQCGELSLFFVHLYLCLHIRAIYMAIGMFLTCGPAW